MCFFQVLFEIFSENLSLQIFCGKDIFGHGFGKDFSVNIICFVDFFLVYFLVGVSFENCFVKISLQGVLW